MKKIIVSLLIGFFFGYAVEAQAYRFSKPLRITAFDENGLVIINETLERLWDVVNGRYSPNYSTTASTGAGTVKMGSAGNANNAGWISFQGTDGVPMYIPYWTDDTP